MAKQKEDKKEGVKVFKKNYLLPGMIEPVGKGTEVNDEYIAICKAANIDISKLTD